ncbi:MAG: hypothetical protein IT317_13135 [Anaerolineales bacterium]|nr:hypothetical protein [Anaerolineales bacterium]
MPAPWRACGLGLLLALAAACAEAPAPTPTARPSFTPPAARTATTSAPAATETQAVPTATATVPPEATATPNPDATNASPATASPEGPATAGVTPTPTDGPCANDVAYIADLSVPDGTAFEPGAALVKQWSVRNAGTCDWDAGYHLVLVSGNALGARSELALYPARAGLEAVIEVPMIAPAEPGTYTGRWQARDPNGNVFGDRIFITINVVAPATPTETVTATP